MSFLPENISNFNLISVLKPRWNNFDKEALPRPFHALSFRVKGDSTFSVTSKSKVHLTTGDILFVPHNLGYRITAKEESLFCIHFTADNLPTDNIYVFSPTDRKVFEKLFAEMYHCWIEKKPGYHNQTSSLFFTILSKMQSQPAEVSYSCNHSLILNTIDYIHEHFTEPMLTIPRLSQISSLSETYFRKEFKRITGVSPLQYINDLRIAHALELLESGYYKIYEIAEKSGFSDSKYFSTVIKKATGYSPKALHDSGQI